MRNHILVIGLFILSGCTTFSENYNEAGLQEDELALVTGSYKPGIFYTEHAVYISEVYDVNGNQVLGNPNPKSWDYARLEQVRLQPGEYLFYTRCENGYSYALLNITLLVKASKTYLLTCERIMKKDFFGINVLDKIELSVKETDSY